MASKGINKAILIGRMGKYPEVRAMPNGNMVANFSVATSEEWKDKQTGEKKEKTEWHNIVIYGKLAEIVGQYVKKGDQLYLEGKLQTRKWQDQSGNDRYTTEVVANMIQMLGGGRQNESSSPQSTSAPQQQDDEFGDSIPF